MRKKLITLIVSMSIFSLTACGNVVDGTKEAVNVYNETVKEYNEQVGDYIIASQAIVEANKELNDIMNAAQEVINKGEEPFDEETLTTLKSAMSTAADSQIKNPELLPVYEELSVDENASKDDLKALKEQVEGRYKSNTRS